MICLLNLVCLGPFERLLHLVLLHLILLLLPLPRMVYSLDDSTGR